MKHILRTLAALCSAFALLISVVPSARAAGWVTQDSQLSDGIFGIDCSGNFCVAVGDNGALSYKTDGKTWQAASTGVSTYLSAVDVYSSTSAVVVGESGVILRTTNSGETWTAVTGVTSSTLHDVVMASTTTGYAVSEDSEVFKTTDGGATWTSQSTGLSLSGLAIDATSSSVVYVAGASGAMYKTTNGGTSWSAVTTGTTTTITALDAVSSSVVYYGGSSGFVAKTTDGGSSFTALVAGFGMTEFVAEVACTAALNCMAVGNNGTIKTTTDGGSSWSSLSTGDSTALYALTYSAVGQRYVGGENGALYRYDVYGPDAVTNFTLSGGDTTTTDTTPTFTWDAVIDDEGDVAFIEIDVDGSGWENVGSASATEFTWTTALSVGAHTATIRATDTVDNVSNETTLTFTIEEPSTTDTSDDGSSGTDTGSDDSTDIGIDAEASAGDLIKTACPGGEDVNDPCRAVYYLGADGKRHAFPNEKVFFTWYTNFDSVVTVSSTYMASLTLGRNVTYHPGTKMVKFQSVNTVYGVGTDGELRPIDSEATAAAIYGSTWNRQIDDISDAFYSNYSFGLEITSASDFDADAVEASIDSIDDIL